MVLEESQQPLQHNHMGKKRVAQKAGEETIKEVSQTQEKPLQIKTGRIYIFSSYNNTIMSLTDIRGNVLSNVSAGAIGFKGTKKSTPFAASKVAEAISQIAKNKGIDKVEVFVKGIGAGRDSALRSIGAKEFEVLMIKDITPIPHNGPRPPKVRRV